MNFCVLLTLLMFTCQEVMCQSGDIEGHCLRVLHIFPDKLRELRVSFQKVKNYFQMKDDALNTILLQDNLLQDFKGSMGCQSVSEMIRFYLEDVLPRASDTGKAVKMNVAFLGNQLLDLKQTLRRC
ncbi:hypothetical protein FKM82_016878, partial [Ascaphus truei]